MNPGPRERFRIGLRIRQARLAAKMTQAQLARKLGLSYQFVQRFERGDKLLIERIPQLAAALSVEPDMLIQPILKGRRMNSPQQNPSQIGFYSRLAMGHTVEADVKVKAACGLPADAPANLAWEDWYNRVHVDDRAQLDAQLSHLHDPHNGVFEMQYRLVGIDGVERKIVDFGRMIFNGHRPTRLIGFMMDITAEPRNANTRKWLTQMIASFSKHDGS